MPLQNRVTPYGEIVATEERGTLMGNRGILHENRKIFRKTHCPGWITCLLEFKNVHRIVMTEDKYTELFFLDEATAFAAGHRPCGECQRKRYNLFKSIWLSVNCELYGLNDPKMPQVDRVINRERIHRGQEKITYLDAAVNVAGGAFIEHDDKPYLKWKNNYYEWTFAGYVSVIEIPEDHKVKVITPRSIVRCFENGLVPVVHDSIKVIEL